MARPKLNIRQGDGLGAGMGFRGGRGVPGYPLPAAMQQDIGDLEDVVSETLVDLIISSDIIDKKGGIELVPAGPPAGIVDPVSVKRGMNESGIDHLDDLDPQTFMRFLKKYKDVEIDGGLDISEKIDGSARLTFGVVEETDPDDTSKPLKRLWTQSKNGLKRFSSEEYGDDQIYSSIKAAHQALESRADVIKKAWPRHVESVVAEVLHTKIPNSIEYGPNAIIMHGVNYADASPTELGHRNQMQVCTSLAAAAGDLEGPTGTWLFEYRKSVPAKDVAADVSKEFDSLGAIAQELEKLRPDKLKKVGKVAYNDALGRFKAVQALVKDKLLNQLRKMSSAYGPEGGDVEGLVFQDLDTGELTKLVDKDYFTKLNKFMWQYRELLDRGAKVNDVWEHGVMQKFRNAVGDDVVGDPVAKTPGFMGAIAKVAGKLHEKDPERRLDLALQAYIKARNLLQGDFMGRLDKALADSRDAYDSLLKKWNSAKKGSLSTVVSSGDKKKTVTMDPIIIKRTDDAFERFASFLDDTKKTIDVVKGMSNEDTQKVAVIKVLLGETRLEKLKHQIGGAKVTEAVGETPSMTANRTNNSVDVLQYFADKLSKRGIKVPDQPHVLGRGTRAITVDLQDGRVVKVTNDPSDAKVSFKIKDLKMKHVVRVDDVFRFPKTHMGSMLFGIVSEKLAPIPGTTEEPTSSTGEAKELNSAIQDTFFIQTSQYFHGGSWKENLARMYKYLSIAKSEQGFGDATEVQERFIKGLETLKRYQIPSMVDELHGHGIKFYDYHAGNIMKKHDGSYALIDLGYSKNEGLKEPPMLEKKRLKEDIEDLPLYRGIVKRHLDQMAKRGIDIDPQKHLGGGSNGVIFDAGAGKVLKVTIDEDEAMASNHVKGKKLKHIVHVFDVFKFKTHPNNEGDFYGIVMERLQPLPPHDALEINKAIDILDKKIGIDWNMSGGHAKIQRVLTKLSKEDQTVITAALGFLNEKGVFEVIDELVENEIDWGDLHANNLMKRGSDLVAVDLGVSESPGAIPGQIETLVRESLQNLLREAKADQVGVTIGRFQPFHRGHAEVIRNLARRFSKVIVIVAGNGKDKKNPFSYDTRLDLIKKSLPDVFSKLEVHKAQFGGKNSGYLPGVLSDISKNTNSSVEGDTAVTILVGEDRFEDVKKQIDHARQLKQQGKSTLDFDPDLAIVQKLPDVKGDDEAGRVSGTRVRQALVDGDQKSFADMMDPHLVSNPVDLKDIYARLRSELGMNEGVVNEAMDKISEPDIIDALEANEKALERYGIRSSSLKKLGGGLDGIAYDIGGNKVLKVTTDVPEAKAANTLREKGQTLRHVVHVDHVFRFKPQTVYRGADLFGIIEEKLSPLSQQEKAEFEKVSSFWLDPNYQKFTKKYVETGNYEGLIDGIRDVLKDLESSGEGWNMGESVFQPSSSPSTKTATTAPARSIKTKTSPTKQDPAAATTDTAKGLEPDPNRISRQVKYIDQTLRKFKLPEMMKDLRSLGIMFSDYHEDNVMKRGSEYVVNDLGRSEGGLAQNIPDLEEVVEETIKEVLFAGPGNTQVGVRAGSSAQSRPLHPEDPDTQEIWQDKLKKSPIGHGSL